MLDSRTDAGLNTCRHIFVHICVNKRRGVMGGGGEERIEGNF